MLTVMCAFAMHSPRYTCSYTVCFCCVFTQIISDAVNSTRQRGKDLSMREAIDSQLKERGLDQNNVQTLLLQSLPSYVISEYSALHYQADSLDFGYDKVLLDGMGELVDR